MAESEIKSILKSKPTYRELYRSIPLVRDLVKEADRKNYRRIMVYSAFEAPVTAGMMFGIKLVTDGVLNRSVRETVMALTLMGVAGIVSNVAGAKREVAVDALRFSFERHLDLITMRHMARLPLATLDSPNFRELNQAFREKRHVALNIVDIMMETPAFAFALLGVVTAIAYVPWFVMGLLIASFLLRLALMLRVAHFNWAVLSYETREGRMGQSFRNYLISVRHLLQCKILGLAGYFTGRWDKVFREIEREKIKVVESSAQAGMWSGSMRVLGNVAGMSYIGWQIFQGQAEFSAFTVFMSAYGNLSGMAARLGYMLARLQKDWVFIPLFQRFFALELEQDRGAPVPEGRLRIEFRNVSFAYPGADRYALRDFSETFHEGERIALMGKNGAGKTTLIRLLLGFYKPTSGQILINGVELHQIKPADWFQALSYIPQDSEIFEDKLSELIRQGRVDEDLDCAAMERAAKGVAFDVAVGKLKQGWDSHVGFEWAVEEDQAAKLSGGQEKQLTITRQLYREARLYIFDEGAANLDQQRRNLFYQATGALEGKLVIHSTHDREALKCVDRIIEMPSIESEEDDLQQAVSIRTQDLQ